MKDDKDVIREFNEVVNMTPKDLEQWLKTSDSKECGWTADSKGGESVGHDSGNKIVKILKSNTSKDPDKYTDDQIQHMRKVVAYCKRHLAQEGQLKDKKSTEELKKTKSYASLKNWGHDMLKGKSGSGSKETSDSKNGESKSTGKAQTKSKSKNSDSTAQKAGTKRTTTTRQTRSSTKKEAEAEDDDDNEDDADAGDRDDDGAKGNNKRAKTSNAKGPKPGETVSWQWGSGNPKGKVLDVKAEKASITTKRGNKVTRDGDSKDPAVILDTGKSKAIKSNHELN